MVKITCVLSLEVLRFKFLLPGNDKSKFQQRSYEGLDVFFVQEKRV